MNLLLDTFFKAEIQKALPAWRRLVRTAVELGISVPVLRAALAYYDDYRCARLPANLLQSRGDYFGAHPYARGDKPRGQFFHTNWTGRGCTTASTTYNA